MLNALRHHDGAKYALHACVVMNDHVHALLTPLAAHPLEKIVRAWKSFTARKMARGLSAPGGCWQTEYFDRIVRDEPEWIEKLEYILNNPRKRWPDGEPYPWLWAVGESGE